MKLSAPRRPLAPIRCEDPDPGPGEVRLRVQACGVCRTDLHIADGELALRPGGVIPALRPGYRFWGRVILRDARGGEGASRRACAAGWRLGRRCDR
ncbi:alcohol dehydrogenase catalytic domain-containing protein [Phenylobacterium sp. J426]|uniref:alcohol dehydrogenase catalytic domain-containing protein n=1 Tax=Phenylobacterium sp. J426 TaxID=2898439 RepID=UPI002150C572|nr:alcohol dehydrogenase catalytic domain-containing protein [Phenylobacterium sp. J426]MCR5873396.1 alcohol dehydrogenase catalytic domain-containing protein [Phenylobacterium sp. J426]